MKTPLIVHRRPCLACRRPDNLVLARVRGPVGWQTTAIHLCECDPSRVRVPAEWRSAEPDPSLIDAVRRVASGEPILMEGSQEPCHTLEAVFGGWGDLTQPKAFRHNGTAAAAAGTGTTAQSNDIDPTGDAALVESTATKSRGPVFEAARQYIKRGYGIVPLSGVQGEACTCPKGKECQSPGKHPLGKSWQERPVHTVERLRKGWDARRGRATNIGILLRDEFRLLLIDVDVKGGKKGLASLAEWERQLGISFDAYLTQVTPSGGRHYVFRVPAGTDLGSLPNRTEVTPGIDVLRHKRQFVVSPSQVLGNRRYHRPGEQESVVLPPIDELPEIPTALLEHLTTLGGDHTETRESDKDPESARAPSVERVREVVSHILNHGDVDRNKYVWMAHAILGACGHDNKADAREIFLEWAARYPDPDPSRDARAFDTLQWENIPVGWTELWRLAARYSYDASAEQLGEAQEEFGAEPPTSDEYDANKGNGERSERAQDSSRWKGPVADLLRSIELQQLANPDRQHEVLRAFAEGFHRLPLEVQPAAEAAMLQLFRKLVPHARAEKLLWYAIAPSAVEPPYEITSEGQAVYRTLDVRTYDPDEQHLIHGVLPSRSVAMISADMSMGKSWIALEMALDLSFGESFLGHEVSNASPVAYLATEGAYSLIWRCAGWLIDHGLLNEQHTLADLYDVLDGKLYVVPNPLPFDHPHFEATFRGTVTTTGAPLVICDTLGKMLGREQNENDSNAANAVTGMLSRLCHETGTTALLLHHTGYGDAARARGSSAWEQGCDLTFIITGTRDDLQNGRPLTLVERKPWRGGALDLRLPFKLTTSEVYLLNPDAEPVELDKSNPVAVINHPGQYMTGRLEQPTSADFGHLGVGLKSLVTVRSGCKVQVLHFALQVMAELHESRSKAGDEEGVSRTDFTAAYNERVEEAAAEQDYQGKALKLDKNGAVALIGHLRDAGLLGKEGSGTKTRYRVTSAGLECAIKTAEQFAGLWEPPA